MTATTGIWALVQKGLAWLGVVLTALGLWVTLSVIRPTLEDFTQRGVGFTLEALLLLSPALVVLALAFPLLRRAGEPPLWFLLLSISVGCLSLWIGAQFAMYAA